MAAPKKYPDELRERAVRLYRESDPKPVIRAAGRAAWGASRGVAQLDPPGRGRPWRARRPADHRGGGGDPPAAAGERRAAAGQRDPEGRVALFSPRSSTRPGDGRDVRRRAARPLRGRAPSSGSSTLAVSTYYGWLAQAGRPAAATRGRVDLGLLAASRDPRRVRAHLRRRRVHASCAAHGIRGGPQAGRAADARPGLAGRVPAPRLARRRRPGQNPKATPAPDLVNRHFTAAAPNRLWVADATRIPCGEGVFWLAAVRDVFSNRIVGWKTSDRCDTDLILGALEYGIWSRDVRDGQLIHHSATTGRTTRRSGSPNAWRTTGSCPRWGPSATVTTTR